MRQLYIQDGVVVANPARVIVLAQMLRRQIVQAYTLRLSNEAKIEKTARLYEFITSARCGELFKQMSTLTDDMLEIDVKETKAHQVVWKRRGEIIRGLQKVHGDLSAEIDTIIGTAQ